MTDLSEGVETKAPPTDAERLDALEKTVAWLLDELGRHISLRRPAEPPAPAEGQTQRE